MNEKEVFISHSSLDFGFASTLCSIFEQSGISCWIAPRDIPYGNMWSGEIADAIDKSKVMVFIFSENSNKSRQVLNEIYLALQNGIPVIPVRLTTQPYNSALKYLLALQQWIDNEDESEEVVQMLAEKVAIYLNGGEDFSDITRENDCEIDSTFNIDDEIEAQASRILTEDKSESIPVSYFKKRLLDRLSEKFTEQLFVVPDSNEGETEPVEIEKQSHFSVTEIESTTLVFIIRRKINGDDFSEGYYAEELECDREELGDGSMRTTYYIDYLDREGNPLALVTFPKNNSVAMIDSGFADKTGVRISNKPEVMELSMFSKEDGTIKRYGAKENTRSILIDPITCTVIPRKRVFDKKSKEWVYYVEIISEKKYFVLRIDADFQKTASEFNIAYGYYKGRYGLTQNVIEAATRFAAIESKEAYYYLAQIFKDDPLLKNEEDYLYYKRKSEEA